MPAKKDAAYWRNYRASHGAVAPVLAEPERRYVNPPGQSSKYQYLPGDHAVGDMTQRGRDRVLARMNAR